MEKRGYSADWLYQLKQKNDIVSIVNRYVHLDKKGKSYWGCCPFHNEKTPSFTVNEDEGRFYCFGCKENGDVISFVQKIESCDFMDAVKILAENAHMQLPEFTGDPKKKEQKQLKERLLKLLECTYKYYQENLYKPEAKAAQDYVKKRGFTRRELEDFKLGFSINWTDLVDFLRRQGFTYKEMLDAGVVQKKESEGKQDYYYDVMAERLTFPIFNAMGDCVGFSARALEKVDFAKYKNTSETLLFQKGRVVFGINLLRKLKQTGGLSQIIIVEGQIDVIAMHRAGFKSTVACMGTALTGENAHELKKMCNDIVLCFDGDEAGIKATKRSIEILKEQGFNVKVVPLPEKQDPDEIIKEKGKEFMEELIKNALTVIDYYIHIEKQNFDLSNSEEKAKFIMAMLEHIRQNEDLSSQDVYLEKIRDLTGVPMDILRRDLIRKVPVVKKDKKEEENVLIARENGNIRAIKYVLSSLIFNKEYVDKRIDYFRLIPEAKEIIEKALEHIPISSYYDYFDVDNSPLLRDIITFNFEEYSQDEKRSFDECLWLLADLKLKEKQALLTEKFKSCEDNLRRLEIAKALGDVARELKQKSLEEFYVR